MNLYRYPGSKPFTQRDSPVYFGRDLDTDRLFRYVIVNNLVVIYGKSGLGKSSLLNAGLLPRLAAEKSYQTYFVRFNNYTPETSYTPLQVVIKTITADYTPETFLQEIEPQKISLWQYLKAKDIVAQEQQKYILVFDQFEELFTYPNGIDAFSREIAELLERKTPFDFQRKLNNLLDHNPNIFSESQIDQIMRPLHVKIVLAIRSDKLSLLNRLKDHIHNILQNCYEIKAFDRTQAIEALVNPAQATDQVYATPPFAYHPDALRLILEFLSNNQDQTVEGSQLQIVGQYVEQHLVGQTPNKTVTAEDIGDLAYVVENYYEWLIEELCEKETDRNAVHHFIENGLIFEPEQRRISLFKGQIKANFNISDTMLNRLVDSHVLRAEAGTGGVYYELSHDTLVNPILKAKEKRFFTEKQNEEQEKVRQIAEKQVEAERQKAQFAAQKIKRRVQRIAITVLVLIAISAGLGYYQSRKQNEKLENTTKSLNAYVDELTFVNKSNKKLLDSLRKYSQEKLVLQEQLRSTERQNYFKELESKQNELDSIQGLYKNVKRLEQTINFRYESLDEKHQKLTENYTNLKKDMENLENRLKVGYRSLKDREYQQLRQNVLEEYKKIRSKY